MKLPVDHYHFPTIASTNNWAKANARHLNPERLTIVTASEQTAGRGRHERQWISPIGVNLYVSYCLFVPQHRKDISNIPQVIALTTADFICKNDLKASLKWPNDVLIESKKVGGVLCDTTPVDDKVCVIVGLGLNVNMPPSALQQLEKPATSLAVEAGHTFDLDTIAEELQTTIRHALELFLKQGFPPFLARFREALIHRLGDTMRFHIGSDVMQGSFHSINDDGTLNLILDDSIQKFNSGEIV